MQGLSEIVPLDILRSYRIGGVSAGSAVAGYFLCALHSGTDMRYWYEKYIRRVMKEVNQKFFGFWSTSDILFNIAKESFIEASQFNVPWNEAFHLYVSVKSGFLSYKKFLIETFHNEEQFAEAISSSCSIPLVTSLGFSSEYQGK